MHGATRVLQEAYQWLQDKCQGELQDLGLTSALDVRRVLYATVRQHLRPRDGAVLPAGAWLSNVLPFQVYARLVTALGPYVMTQPEAPTALLQGAPSSAASSSSVQAVPPPPPPPPPVPETQTRKRQRVPPTSAPSTLHHSPSAAAPSPIGELRVTQPVGLMLDVLLSGITDDIAAEAVRFADDFVLDVPPTAEGPASLRPTDDGVFFWNRVSNRPSGPVTRSSGPYPVLELQRGRWSALEEWGREGGLFAVSDRAAGMRMASDSLQWWLRARPALHRRLGSPAVRPPPWLESGTVSGGELQGTWIFFPVDPGPLPGARQTGFHGSSLHILARAVGVGLENGWNGLTRRGRTCLGVYYHLRERAQYCANYMLYVPLDRSGHLFSCILQLSAPAEDPQGRPTHFRTSGVPQELTYEDVCLVTGVWIHVVHVLHMWTGTRDVRIYAEPRFAAEFELPVDESRESIEHRSRVRADRPSAAD